MGEFNQRYEVLLELMSLWESGKVAHVLEASVLEDTTEGIIIGQGKRWSELKVK